MNQIRDILEIVHFGTNLGLNDSKWQACPGKNGQSCDQTDQSSFFSYQEHFLKVSSKSDKPNSRYIEKGIFWDQKRPNLGLNDGHARARMANHVTKLVSLHYFNTYNLPWKFHQNMMKQIRDIMEKVYFWTNLGRTRGINTGLAWARMGNHVTRLTSLHSFHTKNIPWKFHQNLMNQTWDILENIENRGFWDRFVQLPLPLLPFLPYFSRTGIFPDMRFSREVR